MAKRIFVAMATFAFNVHICEIAKDGSLRALRWGKLTRAERRRYKELVDLLGPDGCESGLCAYRSPNPPKTAEQAKALAEFVASVERRHGANGWITFGTGDSVQHILSAAYKDFPAQPFAL